MNDTPILDPPIPLAKAIVVVTRVTICECGERYHAPEVYERHAPHAHWSFKTIHHLRRRTSMPTHRLPVERHIVEDHVPFCEICLALGQPLAGLPLPPDPKAYVGALYREAVVETATKPKPKPKSTPLTVDEIFEVLL